jgi:hypothetical protein
MAGKSRQRRPDMKNDNRPTRSAVFITGGRRQGAFAALITAGELAPVRIYRPAIDTVEADSRAIFTTAKTSLPTRK